MGSFVHLHAVDDPNITLERITSLVDEVKLQTLYPAPYFFNNSVHQHVMGNDHEHLAVLFAKQERQLSHHGDGDGRLLCFVYSTRERKLSTGLRL